MRGGLAGPSQTHPHEGAGQSPAPFKPPPMEGVVHPLQTSPAHAVAAPDRGRGLISLTPQCRIRPCVVKDERFPHVWTARGMQDFCL